MSAASQSGSPVCNQVLETFWETFPPFWHRVRAHIRQVALEQFEISVEQFHILRHIRHGADSVSEIAEAKNTSRPAISQAVDVLVNKGLITRTQSPADRRHVSLTLTADGNTTLDAIYEQTRCRIAQMLSALTDEELETLSSAMKSLRKMAAG